MDPQIKGGGDHQAGAFGLIQQLGQPADAVADGLFHQGVAAGRDGGGKVVLVAVGGAGDHHRPGGVQSGVAGPGGGAALGLQQGASFGRGVEADHRLAEGQGIAGMAQTDAAEAENGDHPRISPKAWATRVTSSPVMPTNSGRLRQRA